MLAARVVDQGLHRGTATKFGSFVEDFFNRLTVEVEKGIKSKEKELLAYQQAVSYGLAEGDSVKARINILTKRISAYSPEFSALLGAYHEAATAATKSISEQADVIKTLIHSVNRKYSAKHGEDLFKLTNESSSALQGLSHPCRSQHDYGELIDGLYFLVHEGSGSCNRLPLPRQDFAMDVKFLRTMIRHDLDHGSAAEIAKKKRRNASVFKKYSGKASPDECGPEDFLTTQLRIFEDMKVFLESLA
jgi:hypothetical protein